MTTKPKKKIFVIADSPLVPSGVGTQTKYMIEALLKTGEYKFLCLAGALKHNDYRPIKVEPYGEDLIIHPVDGYGNATIVRQVLHQFKPDVLWFMTDPRFFIWLWQLEDEIRKNVPMVYYHVWDNFPYPYYNKSFYDSNDVICTISDVTDQIVRKVSPDVKCVRIPHTVNTEIFKALPTSKLGTLNEKLNSLSNKMVFFWNNRNARRKQSGTLIFWFKDFLDKVGHDKAALIMHTEPKDPNGQDLEVIAERLGLKSDQIMFSTQKMPPEELAKIYSFVDCTINISDAEGFGLSTLESLACETPVIVNMTGGLQEQVTDGQGNWFGIGIEPSSKAVIGSQDVPYIYEDRISRGDFLKALEDFYNTPKEERLKMGKSGRNHVLTNYGFEQYESNWRELFEYVTQNLGSWENRKNYQSWELIKDL